MERTEESILIIKTQSSRYAQVESFLKREHPYECPEILEIPVGRGSADYLQWLAGESDGMAADESIWENGPGPAGED